MRKTESECVSCGLPCLGIACPYNSVTRYYCDECKEEAELYYFDGLELCIDCITKKLDKVEESFYV